MIYKQSVKVLAQRGLGESSEPNADPEDRSPSSAAGPLVTEFREDCGRSGCGYLGKYMRLRVSRNRCVQGACHDLRVLTWAKEEEYGIGNPQAGSGFE